MPRTARKKSPTGIYHVVLRGINKQTIFYDDEDRKVFLNRLKINKEKISYEIYSFCMMSNHIHILINELDNSIGKIFQKILGSYVYWYNRKYERIGNLFQDRFKSETINSEGHLLSAVRYIHQNPIKAGIAKSIEEYEWSSYSAYVSDKKGFINTDYILRILDGKDKFIKFMNEVEEKPFIEFNNTASISDKKLQDQIERIYSKYKISNILTLEKGGRNEIVSIIKAIPGTSIRQIARITGIPISTIRHIK
ncbi:MAG: transposase [Firmicutes bacterium]|nr:transposase [Bacillota bacterium]